MNRAWTGAGWTFGQPAGVWSWPPLRVRRPPETDGTAGAKPAANEVGSRSVPDLRSGQVLNPFWPLHDLTPSGVRSRSVRSCSGSRPAGPVWRGSCSSRVPVVSSWLVALRSFQVPRGSFRQVFWPTVCQILVKLTSNYALLLSFGLKV